MGRYRQQTAMLRGQLLTVLQFPFFAGKVIFHRNPASNFSRRQTAVADTYHLGRIPPDNLPGTLYLQAAGKHSRQTQQQRKSRQKYHHHDNQPTEPFPICPIKYHAAHKSCEPNKSSPNHISAAWAQVPAPAPGLAPVLLSNPAPPPWGKAAAGGQRYG